jgi:type VI secretion system protein ImpB
MGSKSVQHKLSRVRPPRVHITTDVETGDAIELKELPFVVGVMGDFSGQPDERDLRDRKFTEINPGNFDKVLEAMRPRLQGLRVANKLQPENPKADNLSVNLTFKTMEDFEPQKVAEQVPALKDLLDLRGKLSNLKSSLQGNMKFEKLLQQAIDDTGKTDLLANEIGVKDQK